MNELIPYLDKRLDRLEDKVDAVIVTVDNIKKFKWQIIGGAGVVSFIVSVALLAIFGSH